jgi:hypothetical protein
MRGRRPKQEALRCVYCGAVIAKGRSCPAHRELERVDPHEGAMREALTEGQLGVRPWHRIQKRKDREEFY